MHLDRAGKVGKFPTATVNTQRDELKNAFWPNPGTAGPYIASDFSMLRSGISRSMRDKQPLIELDGDLDLFGDGSIYVHRAVSHTPGIQLIRLPKTGLLILTSDVCYRARSATQKRRPIACGSNWQGRNELTAWNLRTDSAQIRQPRCFEMASMVVLDLLGGVALLLWGLHMVRSGIMRAFGSNLRRVLGLAMRDRLTAFLAGLGITAVLQSSTATGLMTASFAGAGLMDLVPALAVMLGANVGTTLIVQALSFNVSTAAPALFLIGLIAFNRGRRTWIRDVGRVAIGLGLMLLALHILLDALAPAENAPGVRVLLAAITGEPILCLPTHNSSRQSQPSRSCLAPI
jgi:hypothetical protein